MTLFVVTFSTSRVEAAGPGWDDIVRVVSLRDYNTRVVLSGTSLLGICAGTVGTFLLLRRRSLVGDVVGHAALPGIALAFIVMEAVSPGSGKSLPGLLAGALVAGTAGVLCMTAIRRCSRIPDDAAMAIVLGLFFGLGAALLTVVQKLPAGNAAGLRNFVYGEAASMTAGDVGLIAAAALVVLVVCGLLFKEFSVLCFDEEYAGVQGWPVGRLDLLLMALAVGVTVIGLRSVGGLLVVALLIIPPAAARFWTDDLRRMAVTSAAIGGLSCFLGAAASALVPRLAAGAVIVLVGAALFVVSLLCGVRRGLIPRTIVQWRVRRRIGRTDLLRAFYEVLEPLVSRPDDLTRHEVLFERLRAMRSWPAPQLRRLLARAIREGLLEPLPQDRYRLTKTGAAEACRAVRNHRLWETYLITYADIAPSHVDRDADQIEHVLEPELVRELEAIMARHSPPRTMPPSPHPI